jgi:hypothetical protein
MVARNDPRHVPFNRGYQSHITRGNKGFQELHIAVVVLACDLDNEAKTTFDDASACVRIARGVVLLE